MAEQKKKQSGAASKAAKAEAIERERKKQAAGSRVRDEIWSIVIIALGAFLAVALLTDAAGTVGELISRILKGSFGALAVWVLPYYLIVYGILLFAKKTAPIGGRSSIFMFVIFLMGCVMNSARFLDADSLFYLPAFYKEIFAGGVLLENGGWFGMVIGSALIQLLGVPGLWIVSLVMITVSVILVFNTPVSAFLDRARVKRVAKRKARAAGFELAVPAVEEAPVKKAPAAPPVNKEPLSVQVQRELAAEKAKIQAEAAAALPEPVVPTPRAKDHSSHGPQSRPGVILPGQANILQLMNDDNLFNSPVSEKAGLGLEAAEGAAAGFGLEPSAEQRTEEPSMPDLGLEHAAAAGMIAGAVLSNADMEPKDKKQIPKEAAASTLDPAEINQTAAVISYRLPPLELLHAKPASKSVDNRLPEKAMKLEETLRNFKVDARVINVTQGPAVTRYEIQPNVGVKVSKISGLANDIALNMEAKSIRIEAPIPGKAAVGIEIENEKINMVTIREVVGSKEFKEAKSKITFAVGKDIGGKAIVSDLKGMPHLLIAGSTGSGKSVCINSIITSILYKAKPEEVKFVLIDPKVVELGNYNGIPHMLIPVVTDPAKAAAALNWAVAEMTDRYKKFAEESVRDLDGYNESAAAKNEPERILPQIVIIIDELADLMMASPSQVEESICRLAQMARAAGMHLIVATQRPSVDVITGVIKANIPSRIAFAVSSIYDSRTILDMAGAENLVGKGDMLFAPMGLSKPIRVQGNFISDGEVNDVIDYVKAQAADVTYSEDAMSSLDRTGQGAAEEQDFDDLLPEAIETVVKSGQASTSMLQRRFRIGYNRAARIMDMMESRGIIGPADGSRPRQVLLTETELYAMQDSGNSEEL